MEKHKCKLCSRRFPSGRALGGHMKSHLTTPKKQEKHTLVVVSESTQASSSLCSWQEQEEEEGEKVEITEEKGVGYYGLRENPKKSFRLVDPQFLDAAGSGSGVVVQDRESETETESTQKLLTQRRSKRTRRSMADDDVKEMKKKKPKLRKPSSTDSLVDQEPVSSVSNGSPEEDLALCLIMLSKDVWTNSVDSQPRKAKVFNEQSKMHECPFCGKRFESGQALGGHKRSHLLKTLKNQDVQSDEVEEISNSRDKKIQEVLMIDLNLPAEDEENEQDFWA